MISEDYVSFETAKLLKEKGFDECLLFYYDDSLYTVPEQAYEVAINYCLENLI